MNYRCLEQQAHPVACNTCGSDKHFNHACPETNPRRCIYCRNLVCDCGKKYFIPKKREVH